MKYLSEKITDYIVKVGAVSEESYAIYQYGFQIGLEMISCFLVCFGISICLHMIPQFFVFTGIFMLLRTYAGGLHLNSYLGCFMCSLITQTIILLITTRYTIILPVAWTIIWSSAVLILINAPVETKNRELDEDEKKYCKKITTKILIGVIFYMTLISSYVIKVNVTIINFIKNIIQKIFKILITPFKWIYQFVKRILYKPLGFVRKLIIRSGDKLTSKKENFIKILQKNLNLNKEKHLSR